MRFAAPLLAAGLIGASTPTAGPDAATPIQVVDIMPAFWAVWDNTAGKPISVRVERFREDVVDPNDGVYGFSEFDYVLASDRRMAAYLQHLEPQTDAMRAIGERIDRQFPSIAASVTEQLPGLTTGRIVVYFMPSLGHFVGQTHDLGPDKVAVMFGIDRTAEVYGAEANLGVEVAHELFHIYQFEMHSSEPEDRAALWQAVWIEGSAAYASQILTPGSVAAQALNPELASANAATIKDLACGIEQKWNSHDDGDMAFYLDAGMKTPGVPAMGGYLVGYLVAKDIAKTHSLADIGKLVDPERERLVRAGVHRLCIAPGS